MLSPEQIAELRSLDLDDLELYPSEKCNPCAILRVCPTCYGLNDKVRGKLSGRDLKIASLTKAFISNELVFHVDSQPPERFQ